MKKQFKIPVDLYKTDVHVSIGVSDDEFSKYVRRYVKNYFVVDSEAMKESTDAFVLRHESGLLFIRLRSDFTQAFLAHEILHCVFAIMNRCGVVYSEDSEESFTYLMEYLTDKINKKL